MPIWTTPQLNDLLVIKELPLRLFPAHEVQERFLAQAAPGDIAIISLDDDYLQFLHEAKDRDIQGPILLISPEPTIIEADLRRYNAIVLDLKKMGPSVVKNLVHVVIELAARQRGIVSDVAGIVGSSQREEDRPIDNTATIRERLGYVLQKGFPVTIAFEVREDGEPVTARGTCSIKEVRDDGVTFHHFKQSLLLKGMKQGHMVKAYFSYKQMNHEISIIVQSLKDKEIVTTMPVKLFNAKDIRIQPNKNRPIGLYVLIPNEPTVNYRVIDISPRGLGFLCTRDLPMNSVFSFTIILPDPRAVVVTGGFIRFKKETTEGIRYGVEMRPHPWDEESIAKYLMKRETEIMGLLRDL
jgi:hypothetical protein